MSQKKKNQIKITSIHPMMTKHKAGNKFLNKNVNDFDVIKENWQKRKKNHFDL